MVFYNYVSGDTVQSKAHACTTLLKSPILSLIKIFIYDHVYQNKVL
jgi:hypothetical protein